MKNKRKLEFEMRETEGKIVIINKTIKQCLEEYMNLFSEPLSLNLIKITCT
jgi:hypothetical protein